MQRGLQWSPGWEAPLEKMVAVATRAAKLPRKRTEKGGARVRRASKTEDRPRTGRASVEGVGNVVK